MISKMICKDIRVYFNDFVLFFLIYIVVYGFMCLRLGVGVEEAKFARETDWCLLCNGRWGIQLFRFLTSTNDYLPYAAGVIAGIFISVALIFQIYLFRINEMLHKIVYASFYMGCVQWSYQLRFSNQSHALALGMLMLSIAVYLIYNNPCKKNIFLSIILTCWSISIYQTMPLYMAELIVAAELFRFGTNDCDNSKKSLLYGGIVGAVALILYALISLLVAWIYDIPQEIKQFVQEYQGSMVGWKTLFHHNWYDVLRIIGHYFITLPLKGIFGILYEGQSHIISVIIPTILLLLHFFRLLEIRYFLYSFLLIVALLYIPFSISALMLWPGGGRLYIAEPISAAVLWSLIAQRLAIFKLYKIQLLLLSLYIIVVGSCRVSEIARDEYWAFSRSKEELLMMLSRGYHAANEEKLSNFRIVLLGSPVHHSGYFYNVEKEGYRIDEPLSVVFAGGAGWVRDYCRFLRIPCMEMGNEQDFLKHQQCFNEMKTWPSMDSVRVNKGEVIIRVGSQK